MRLVNGKPVLETLSELVDPVRAGLVVVDAQNDYVSPGGMLDRLGYDISMMTTMVQTIARLTDTAHRANVPVFYVQDTRLPGNRSESAPFLRFITLKCGLDADVTVEGSWGWEIADQIAPQAGDVVVRKYREGAFTGTPLDLLLRSHGVETVVMTGDVTQGCLESSARQALLHDYYVVVVRDAVASHRAELHAASLTIMEAKFDVVTCQEVCAQWDVAVRTPVSTSELGPTAAPTAVTPHTP